MWLLFVVALCGINFPLTKYEQVLVLIADEVLGGWSLIREWRGEEGEDWKQKAEEP